MTKEQEVKDILTADAELMAILTGGVYTDEDIGMQGFVRGSGSVVNSAFDAKGVLKPTAVVREGAEIAYATVRSVKDKITGVSQPIEIFFYQNLDRDEIVAAKQRVYELLENTRLPDSYPLTWIGETSVFYDVGPVVGATTLRQDWRCYFLRKPD